MASWLIWNASGLAVVSSVGAMGGSINYLNKKQEIIDVQDSEIELQTEEINAPITGEKRGLSLRNRPPKTVQLPRGVESCAWLYYNGYKRMRTKREEDCMKFAKNQLKITFEKVQQ